MAEAMVEWPVTGEWTLADLNRLPDDGRRYEIFDGGLFVAAAPTSQHQSAVYGLMKLLEAALPAGLRAVLGVGIHIAATVEHKERVPVPDVLVIRGYDPDANSYNPADVVLAVEVVSPTSVAHDFVLKRRIYAEAGVPHYWIVETRPEPRVTLLALTAGQYVETTRVSGDEELPVTEPVGVTLRPADLVAV